MCSHLCPLSEPEIVFGPKVQSFYPQSTFKMIPVTPSLTLIPFSFLGVHDFMNPHILLGSSSPLPFPLFCFHPLFTFLFYPSHIHTSVVDSQSGTLKLSSGVARPPNVFGDFELKILHLVCKRPYHKVFMRLSAGWYVTAGHRAALTVELWSSNTQ